MNDLFEILDKEDVRRRLAALTDASGISFSIRPADAPEAGDDTISCPIKLGSSPSGYLLCTKAADMNSDRLASLAAFIAGEMGEIAAAEADLANLAQEIAERYEEINFLYDISLEIGSVQDVKSVCHLIVERASRVLRVERCSVLLLEKDGKYLRLIAGVGLPEGMSPGLRVPLDEGASGRVAATGEPVVVSSPEQLKDYTYCTGDLEGARHFASYPLLASDDEGEEPSVLGVLDMADKVDGKMFTSSDLRLIESIAAHTATHIRNCTLNEARRQQQALESEIRLAASIQLGLLPDGPICARDLTVAGFCRPAHNVGGDYYDYWLVRPGIIGAVIGDVSGHNIAAALVASSFRTTIRNLAALGGGVRKTVASVNEAMFDDLCRLDMFLSLFYLEYNLETGKLDFCRAGHTKPLFLSGAEAEWLDTEGPLIGIDRQADYEQKSRFMKPGQVLVLYTDGLTEAGCDADQFGEDGLYQAVLRTMRLTAEDIAGRLVDAACAHLKEQNQGDDMAVVVLKRNL